MSIDTRGWTKKHSPKGAAINLEAERKASHQRRDARMGNPQFEGLHLGKPRISLGNGAYKVGGGEAGPHGDNAFLRGI